MAFGLLNNRRRLLLTTLLTQVVSTKANDFQDTIPSLNFTYDLLQLSHKMYDIDSVDDQDIPPFLTPHSFISTFRSTEALISTNDEESYIVVGFRGTNETLDFAINFLGQMGGFYGPIFDIYEDAGFVHMGQDRNLDFGVYKWMYDNINTLIEEYPTYDIIVTGHSLGGALSILSAPRLALDFPDKNVTAITFGTPRCTKRKFKPWARDISNCAIWSIINGPDPVPRAPSDIRGYLHPGHLIQLEDDGATAYFQHLGDGETYAGRPLTWQSERGTLLCDHLSINYLEYYEKKSFNNSDTYYVSEFALL